MLKKLIAGAVSVALMFGMAAALPRKLSGKIGSVISASAIYTFYTYGDYEYRELNDGTVEITKYTGSASTLTIPSEINGKTVTSIGYGSFCE